MEKIGGFNIGTEGRGERLAEGDSSPEKKTYDWGERGKTAGRNSQRDLSDAFIKIKES